MINGVTRIIFFSLNSFFCNGLQNKKIRKNNVKIKIKFKLFIGNTSSYEKKSEF